MYATHVLFTKMENNICSDFGLFITDGDDSFENGYDVPSEDSFDDMKNYDSTETPLIDESRKDQRKIDFYHLYLTSNLKNNFFSSFP